MISIALPAQTSSLPPAAHYSSEIEAGFEKLEFQIEPSPVSSLVTISAYLHGNNVEMGWKRAFAVLSVMSEEVTIVSACPPEVEHGYTYMFSASSVIRVDQDQRRYVTVALEHHRFTILNGFCTLTRLGVAF